MMDKNERKVFNKRRNIVIKELERLQKKYGEPLFASAMNRKKLIDDASKLRLAWVGVGVKQQHYDRYHPGAYNLADDARREKEICESCRIKLGILPPPAKPAEPLPSPPSLEEMIRMIIREEINQ